MLASLASCAPSRPPAVLCRAPRRINEGAQPVIAFGADLRLGTGEIRSELGATLILASHSKSATHRADRIIEIWEGRAVRRMS